MNLEQQHKLAKDLLKAARSGDADALRRIRAHRSDADEPQLADAQLTIAREAGVPSWPALVKHIEQQEMAAFVSAVRKGAPGDVGRVIEASEYVRAHINDPVFDFGQRALHMSASNPALVDVLLSFGGDLGLKSEWENGPYTVLDNADEASARHLIGRGAVLTANVASRLGWMNELRQIVEADRAAVHARGGDGQQPLHAAKTVAIADYLLDHGAGIDVRCIDHHSTPAQYALVERTDVCRRLLARGATPDIFMAAWLGDAALVERLLDANPDAAAARIHRPGYAPVPEMHIYGWTLGFLRSPYDIALGQGHKAVADLINRRSPQRLRFLSAAMRGDEAAARAAIADDPSLPASLTTEESGELALSIFHGRFEAAELMLRLGFDPAAPGVDGGTALHAACWMGHTGLVDALLKRGLDVDLPDPTHLSPPLGWTAFGSVHRRAKSGDYVGVIERLVAAGADISARGNGANVSMVNMAAGNSTVQDALRRLLAEREKR